MMDFLRTITFFTLLITYCDCNKKLCGNSSDASHKISQQDKKEVAGCTQGKSYPHVYCSPYVYLLFFVFCFQS